MASDTTTAQGYEKYYVPESSSLAVRATIGLILSVFGAALMLNDMTFGSEGGVFQFSVGADRRLGVFRFYFGQLVWHGD